MPFPESRLTKIASSNSFQKKQDEINGRITKLAIQTKEKFFDIWNQIPDDEEEEMMEVDDVVLEEKEPSLNNATQFKRFNAMEEKFEYFIQPIDQWLELNELYKYEKSIDSIKKIKRNKALVKWILQQITKEEFIGNNQQPPQKKQKKNVY